MEQGAGEGWSLGGRAGDTQPSSLAHSQLACSSQLMCLRGYITHPEDLALCDFLMTQTKEKLNPTGWNFQWNIKVRGKSNPKSPQECVLVVSEDDIKLRFMFGSGRVREKKKKTPENGSLAILIERKSIWRWDLAKVYSLFLPYNLIDESVVLKSQSTLESPGEKHFKKAKRTLIQGSILRFWLWR